MRNIAPRAALIEIGGSHSECLYSQLLHLSKGGYEVSIIADEKTAGQLQDFELPFKLFTVDTKRRWPALLKIRRFLISNDISTIIFNTAQSSAVRNLTLLPYPRHFRFSGTLHHLNKLQSGSSQKIISRRVKKYFLLNDYLVCKADALAIPGLSFQSYYPIFFPPYPQQALTKSPGSVWINIPGHIEYQRRDYETLVHAFAALEHKPDYLFLLGNGSHPNGNGRQLKTLVEEKGVARHFVFWDDFVAPAEFHGYLRQSDVVMPLIHPASADLHKYLNEQISGNFNLAFAYHKPLLLFQIFDQFNDFRENALFYTIETLQETLMQLPRLLRDIRGRLYQDPKWTQAYQTEHYLAFLKR
jgi:hypothetical protein